MICQPPTNWLVRVSLNWNPVKLAPVPEQQTTIPFLPDVAMDQGNKDTFPCTVLKVSRPFLTILQKKKNTNLGEMGHIRKATLLLLMVLSNLYCLLFLQNPRPSQSVILFVSMLFSYWEVGRNAQN